MAVGVGQRCVVRIKVTDIELRNARDIKATIKSPQGEEECLDVSFDEVSGVVYVSVDVNSVGSWAMWLGVRFDKELFYTPAFVFAEVEGDAKPCDALYIVDVEVSGESVSVTPPKVDVDAVTREEFEQLSKDVAGKVDKIEGKGLSTNDFTNADKSLVNTIPNLVTNEQFEEAQTATSESLTKLAETLEAKADTNGYYPDITVGKADNLVGRGDTQDATINFRPSGGVPDVGNGMNITDGTARIKAIKGNSVVYNQQLYPIVNNGWKVSYPAYASSNISDGAIRVTVNDGVTIANVYQVGIRNNKTGIHSDRYLIRAKVRISAIYAQSNYNFVFEYSSNNVYMQPAITTPNEWVDISLFFEGKENSSANLYIKPPLLFNKAVGGDWYEVKDAILIDLTQEFNAGNEPKTVEEYYQRKPMNIEDEFAYNAGTLVDMHANKIISTSDNAYDYTKAYARVMGGYKYDITANAGATLVVSFYADGEDSNEEREITPDSEGKYIFPANGICYVNGDFASGSDICVCLNHSFDKPHPAHQQVVKDLSFIGEAFPDGMRSAGSAFDEIRFNPTKKKWEKVERVGVRAYVEGDAEDSSVTTDGKTTNYPLDNPTPTTIDLSPNFNLDYFAWDFGTEEAISEDSMGEILSSAPFRADINYEPNAVDDIRWSIKYIRALEQRVLALEQKQNAIESNLTD